MTEPGDSWQSEYFTISLPGYAWLVVWTAVRLLRRINALPGEEGHLLAVEEIVADRLGLDREETPA